MRFSLRTLLVLVTMVCAWFAFHIHWMQQRREALRTLGIEQSPFESARRATFGLRILGELGEDSLGLPSDLSEQDGARVHRLFPETTNFFTAQQVE